jgi:hypothetical protein
MTIADAQDAPAVPAQQDVVNPGTIGEFNNVPAPGSLVASAWAQQATNRLFHRFATYGARTTAFTAPNPTPTRGQACYISSGNFQEGIEFWNGTAWRKPWNMPWGSMEYCGGNIQLTGIGALETALLTSVGFVNPGGRAYRITCSGAISNTEVSNQARFTVRRDPGTAGFAVSVGPMYTTGVVNSIYQAAFSCFDTNPAANALQRYTFALARMSGAGTFAYLGTSYTNFIMIEDIGPAINGLPV